MKAEGKSDVRHLSLFTGAGGGELAAILLGWKTVGYVEWDDYCQRVIAQRIKDRILPNAPIFGDIRAFLDGGYAEAYSGMVDVISAGFPCQPFSVAGKRKGPDDPRNQWPNTIECLRIIRPKFALLENVPGLLATGYCGTIFRDLAEAGYDARWCVLGADDCGANHRRKRLWILAYTKCVGWEKRTGEGVQSKEQESKGSNTNNVCEEGANVVYAMCRGCNKQNAWTAPKQNCNGQKNGIPVGNDKNVVHSKASEWWGTDPADNPRWGDQKTGGPGIPGDGEEHESTEPALGRVAHGVAHRVDRLKALGNGQVPIVAATAWRLLSGQ